MFQDVASQHPSEEMHDVDMQEAVLSHVFSSAASLSVEVSHPHSQCNLLLGHERILVVSCGG